MNKRMIVKVFLVALVTAGTCWAGGCERGLAKQQQDKEPGVVEKILKQLKQKTEELKSYQCRIEYEVNQPLFESKTLRKGVLYYAESGKKSNLRINFGTLKQDDEKEQKYIEQYSFDGVWLTRIDYQVKTVEYRQLVDVNEIDANEPADAFELVSRNFPMVGFSKAEDLKKEFEIKLVEQQKKKEQDYIWLNLKVKPDSIYEDDYTSVDFWIDKKLYLPARIAAVSTEQDIYEVRFIKPKVNKKIDRKVFEIKIPKGFTVGKIPLKKKY